MARRANSIPVICPRTSWAKSPAPYCVNRFAQGSSSLSKLAGQASIMRIKMAQNLWEAPESAKSDLF
ncbi:Hypothetical protein NTJ_02861 [Nesidiocoris tenuis]|uniref:Uncharacterized protein n=1 Tax=Nesidiocoris tenuis TaxID=355587 RepID=A0ABN7ACQ3_9HEMI|nr:Hypothetical protein NTJ_02861 [Nesidiocoris tenuis]